MVLFMANSRSSVGCPRDTNLLVGLTGFIKVHLKLCSNQLMTPCDGKPLGGQCWPGQIQSLGISWTEFRVFYETKLVFLSILVAFVW